MGRYSTKLYTYYNNSSEYYLYNNKKMILINTDNKKSILFDVFLLDILCNDKRLGENLESRVMNYFRNLDEVMEIKNKETQSENKKYSRIKCQNDLYWGESEYFKEFNWINKLEQFSEQAPMNIKIIINEINNESIKKCNNFDDIIYECWPIKGIERDKFIHQESEYLYEVVFTIEEKIKISSYIENNKTEELVALLKDINNRVIKFKAIIKMVSKLLIELRDQMNIPRTFKKEIREANLYGVNLLRYIIEKIDFKKEIDDVDKSYNLNRNKYVSICSTSDLIAFLNQVFYYNYVYKRVLDRKDENGEKVVVLLEVDKKYYLVYYEYEKKGDSLEVYIRILFASDNNYNNIDDNMKKVLFNKIRGSINYENCSKLSIFILHEKDNKVISSIKDIKIAPQE